MILTDVFLGSPLVLEPNQAAPHRPQIPRLELLDDPVDVLPLRRMEDLAVADPEGDVRRVVPVAVGDQVAALQVVDVDRSARGLLLVGVAWHEPAEPSVGHVDEPGAVDAALGHPAPEVGRTQVAAGPFSPAAPPPPAPAP